MLEAVARGTRSWEYAVREDGRTLAVVGIASWREPQEVVVAGAACRLGRHSGAFRLESGDDELAVAIKPLSWTRRFELDLDRERHVLRATSPFTRRFVLEREDRCIGEVREVGRSRRNAEVELPEELSLELRVFVTWLVLVHWRHPTWLGTDLRSIDPIRTSGWVRLLRAGDPVEAHLARALLEGEGIPVNLSGGMAAGAFGELPHDARNVDVFVPEDRVAEATRAYAEQRSD